MDVPNIVALSRSVNWQQFLALSSVSAVSVNLWAWQWELVAATGIGAAMMAAIYTAYDLPWPKYIDIFERLWRSDYQRLLVSVAAGSLGVFTSFGAIALWESVDNHWLVLVLGGQTLMIAALLLLTMKQSWGKDKQDKQFETALGDLCHDSRVKRLATIRFFRQRLLDQGLTAEQQQVLYTFLHLAWREETDAVLREALLSTLSLAQKFEQGINPPTPLASPRVNNEPLRLQKFSSIERPLWRSPQSQRPVKMTRTFQDEGI
ncbi:hypothetical protein NIES208_10035 [[Limnothrix rosea] IAM M-220]|nr:hypothetical protein NIES208_10035 [[Limnothrix rosea] IAM M-220]